MSGIAIVCQAYGTNPTGTLPSQMDTEVCDKAWILAHRNQDVRAIILQGGYSFKGGSKESELMASTFKAPNERYTIIKETESLNTLEGARAILQIAKGEDFETLFVIAEWFHLRRVVATYRSVFRDSGIGLQFFEVYTPFGPNSQSRLRSALSWWPWEIAARIVTPVLLRFNK